MAVWPRQDLRRLPKKGAPLHSESIGDCTVREPDVGVDVERNRPYYGTATVPIRTLFEPDSTTELLVLIFCNGSIQVALWRDEE